jgi:hypothetical protein
MGTHSESALERSANPIYILSLLFACHDPSLVKGQRGRGYLPHSVYQLSAMQLCACFCLYLHADDDGTDLSDLVRACFGTATLLPGFILGFLIGVTAT